MTRYMLHQKTQATPVKKTTKAKTESAIEGAQAQHTHLPSAEQPEVLQAHFVDTGLQLMHTMRCALRRRRQQGGARTPTHVSTSSKGSQFLQT